LEDLFVLVSNVENLLAELNDKQRLITLLADFSKRFDDKLSDSDLSNIFIDAQTAISGLNNKGFLLKSEKVIGDLLKESNQDFVRNELSNLHVGEIENEKGDNFNFLLVNKEIKVDGISLIFSVKGYSKQITVEIANDYKSVSCLGEKASFDVNRNCEPDLKAFLVSRILPKLNSVKGDIAPPAPALSRSDGAVPLSDDLA